MRRPRRQSAKSVPWRTASGVLRLTNLSTWSGRQALSVRRKRWRCHCLLPLSQPVPGGQLRQPGKRVPVKPEPAKVWAEGTQGQAHWSPERWGWGHCAGELRPDRSRQLAKKRGLPVPDKERRPALRRGRKRMPPCRPYSASGHFRSSDAAAGEHARPQGACRGQSPVPRPRRSVRRSGSDARCYRVGPGRDGAWCRHWRCP